MKRDYIDEQSIHRGIMLKTTFSYARLGRWVGGVPTPLGERQTNWGVLSYRACNRF